MNLRGQSKRASGSGELWEEARAAKHQTAKQAHGKQPGSLKLLHLMRSCDPEKKPDFILLIPGSQGASPTHQTYKVRTVKVESCSHLKQSCRCSLG